MNNKVFEAKINWVSKENGGRNYGVPFKINNYAPLISIGGNKVFNGSTWSIICYSYEYTASLTTKAFIKFLNVDAAPNILFVGTEFELFEGAKKVAYGVIIKESVYGSFK